MLGVRKTVFENQHGNCLVGTRVRSKTARFSYIWVVISLRVWYTSLGKPIKVDIMHRDVLYIIKAG